MGLKDTIKDTKEKLDQAIEKESELEKNALETLDKTVSEAISEPKEEKEVKKEPIVEEKPKELTETEPKDDIKPKTDADFAKERIAKKKEKDRLTDELAAANDRIAKLEESINKPVEKPADAEPDINTEPLQWTAWKLRQQEAKIEQLSGWKAEQDTVRQREDLKNRAQSEVIGFENQLKVKYSDYDAVKNHYARLLGASIKIVNPKITDQQLADAVNNRLLTRASELLGEGYENPVEAMYLEAKSLGFQAQQPEKEEIKPDLEKVSSIRKRNAGMAGASGGGGEAEVTAKVAATMTNAEFAKLKPEQKKRLFESLR